MKVKLAALLLIQFFTGKQVLFSQQTAREQNLTVDSLKQALKSAKHDTLRCNILNAMVEAEEDDAIWPQYNRQLKALCENNLKTCPQNSPLRKFYSLRLADAINNLGYLATNQGEYPKALDYYRKGLWIEEALRNKTGIASSLNNMGAIYQYQGNIPSAIRYYRQSLKIQEEVQNKPGIAEALNNIGYISNEQGDIPKALDYYHKSLKMQEEIAAQSQDKAEQRESKKSRGNLLNNIGYIYQYQDNLPKALDYFNKALRLQEEIGDKNGMAASLNNIGQVLSKQKDLTGALAYYQKSLKIVEASANKQGMAHALNNIGTIYALQGSVSAALDYYQRSLKIRQETQDVPGTVQSLNNVADILLSQGKLEDAQAMGEQELKLSRELGFPENMKDASELLSVVYAKTGKWKEAYNMHRLFKQMADSMNKETNHRVAIQKGYQYTYEKKAITDSIHGVEERKVFDAQLRQQKTQRSALYLGIILIALFAGFMYNRFRLTHKQKQIIELKEKETQQQKNIIEEKHKEISDSIYYAERLQRSFLASRSLLDRNLKDYFVFFKPRDVVSGDFYWATELKNGQFIFVAADSTGHGVPGAIMSILNISSLEKAVSEGLHRPADILNRTRETIIERLKKDGSAEGGKDGMDASLICFDFSAGRFSYAAANNPVLVVRNNSLLELPADKMPVGKFEKDERSFTQNDFEFQKGDVIYALTDGLPDQFGGPKGKKFMYKHLKELLLSLAAEPMAVQKQKLDEVFESWKGGLEQVDDVTVVGIRI